MGPAIIGANQGMDFDLEQVEQSLGVRADRRKEGWQAGMKGGWAERGR